MARERSCIIALSIALASCGRTQAAWHAPTESELLAATERLRTALTEGAGDSHLVESVQVTSLALDLITLTGEVKWRVPMKMSCNDWIEVALKSCDEIPHSFAFYFNFTLPGSEEISSLCGGGNHGILRLEFLLEEGKLTGASAHAMEVVPQTALLREAVPVESRLQIGGSLRMTAQDAAWVPIFLDRHAGPPEWVSQLEAEISREPPSFTDTEVELLGHRLWALLTE